MSNLGAERFKSLTLRIFENYDHVRVVSQAKVLVQQVQKWANAEINADIWYAKICSNLFSILVSSPCGVYHHCGALTEAFTYYKHFSAKINSEGKNQFNLLRE